MAGKNGGRKGPPSRGEFSELQLEVRGLGVKMDVLTEHVDALGERMNENTGVLRQILKAVEVGNERRESRVDSIEARVRRLEEHSGLTPPGGR